MRKTQPRSGGHILSARRQSLLRTLQDPAYKQNRTWPSSRRAAAPGAGQWGVGDAGHTGYGAGYPGDPRHSGGRWVMSLC